MAFPEGLKKNQLVRIFVITPIKYDSFPTDLRNTGKSKAGDEMRFEAYLKATAVPQIIEEARNKEIFSAITENELLNLGAIVRALGWTKESKNLSVNEYGHLYFRGTEEEVDSLKAKLEKRDLIANP